MKVTVVFEGRGDAKTYDVDGRVVAAGGLVLDTGPGKEKIIPWHRIAEVGTDQDVPVKAPDSSCDETLSPPRPNHASGRETDLTEDL